LVLTTWVLPCAAREDVVNKWQVFEAEFRSTRSYAEPVHDVRLEVVFASPSGVEHRKYAFWDGSARWKLRFSPDEIGPWSYRTECSDPRNKGLHGRTGSLICTVPSQLSAVARSGPLRTVRGVGHFEHADGTPFFWMADAAVPLALSASSRELREYAGIRSGQGFTVALWRADATGLGEGARSVRPGPQAELHLPTVRRIDDAVELLRDAGLVSAVIPFSESGVSDDVLLPESEIVALLRQMVARWDAYPVTWVMVVEGETDSRRLARSRRILRHVFERVTHAPVLVFCGESYWVLDTLRKDAWVNALGYHTGNNISTEAALWLTAGPLSTLWSQEPRLPLLNLMPATEAGLAMDGSVVSSSDALSVLCGSLFIAPPSGFCYRAHGVETWNTVRDTNTVATLGVSLQEWQKALHLPAAKCLKALHRLLEEARYPTLQPMPALLLNQPGDVDPRLHVSVLADVRCSGVLLHVPAGQEVRLRADRLAAQLEVIRLNLADGTRETQTANPDAGEYRLQAPEGVGCLFLLRSQ
jgi:hypothetical protein